ncbi:MAG: methyltransferase domain-containing protein [Methylococcales bacterium]|nr:methyltransferase domain-containing protein [Methylococcales bacterium]
MIIQALNLGCGKDIKVNENNICWTNVDILPSDGVDIDIDLNKSAWPLEDNKYDLILFKDILEHLDNVVPTMEELHRIAKPNCLIKIAVPYYASKVVYTDPTHRRGFTKHSFDYFAEGRKYSSYNFYTKARFDIQNTRFLTFGPRKFIPFKSILREFLNNITDIIEFDLIVKK